MTLESLRPAYQTTLGTVLCGVLLSLAPPTAVAQTSTGTTTLDDWRGSLNQQLDDEMGRLASASRVETTAATDEVPSEPSSPSSRSDELSDLTYRRNRHWSVDAKSIFQSQGLPVGLIAVAAVESGFNPFAVSPKGAAGLWQFMPATARQYGLVVNASRDDRFDGLRSTLAAARYLRQLYDQFGDWPLALAAYNAGADRVGQGLARFHTHNFWTLSRNFALPDETLDYVPRVLSVMRREPENLDLPLSTSWNRPGKAPDSHFTHPNHQGNIVFATTSPGSSTPETAK